MWGTLTSGWADLAKQTNAVLDEAKGQLTNIAQDVLADIEGENDNQQIQDPSRRLKKPATDTEDDTSDAALSWSADAKDISISTNNTGFHF